MYGLVLEGGGAKGSYQVGAYQAILDCGLEVKAISGTSIGALNGAMIVQGDFKICRELWEDISYSKVINANDEDIRRLRQLKLNIEDLRHLGVKLKDVISDRGLDITPFKNMLNEHVDESKIRESNIDFGIVTVNITDLRAIEIFKDDMPEGMIKDYLLASAFLPVFKNERIGGKHYLDGGVYDNLPYKMLSNKGYKNLIIVRTHPGERTIIQDDTLNEVIVISPSDDIGRSFTYEKDISRKNIKLGYFDGLKAIRGYVGDNYYFYPEGDKYFVNLLYDLEDQRVEKLMDLFNVGNSNKKRALFEDILPKIASILDMNRENNYEDIMLGLFERAMGRLKLEKFEIYRVDDIISKFKSNDVFLTRHKDKTNGFLGRLESLSLKNKDEILAEVVSIMFM